MTERERRLMENLLAFGWGSHDPYHWEKKGQNWWVVEDTGFICPACGGAAPESESFPTLECFSVASNHLASCPLAELIREEP